MQLEALRDIVVAALEEVKAQDIKILDVREIASFTDLMVIASGSSSRGRSPKAAVRAAG